MKEDPVVRNLDRYLANLDYQDDLDRIVEKLEKYQPERVGKLSREQKLSIAESIYEDEKLEAQLRGRGF